MSQAAGPHLQPGRTSLVALLGSAHPGPALVVTALATSLAVALSAGLATTLLVALAFVTGQLSIGWSNDWIDARRDIASGRTDKPVAQGTVSVTAVRTAALAAVALAVAFSVGLGLWGGLAHLGTVAAGWAYNLGLKSTVWSWAPYAVAFGLLPAAVVLTLPGHPSPPVWLVGVGALLGAGAHLVNVLPDLEDDRLTGVRGLGHRLGRTATSLLAPVLLVTGSGLALAGPPGDAPAHTPVVLAVTTGLALVAGGCALAGRRLLPLVAIGAIAIVDVVLILTGVDV